MRKYLLALMFLTLSSSLLTLSAQSAKGTITIYSFKQVSRESLDSVKVSIYRNDTLVGSAITDTYGGHDFKDLPSGTYTIKYSRNGYGSGATTMNLEPGGSHTANIGLSVAHTTKYYPKHGKRQ